MRGFSDMLFQLSVLESFLKSFPVILFPDFEKLFVWLILTKQPARRIIIIRNIFRWKKT